MRNYGKIESGFWQNKKVRPLSDRAKLLLLYIYSCPHSNSVGCFRLPTGYISEDIGWSFEHVTEHVTELVSKGFLEVDIDTKLLRIIGWFDHNTIENDNVAKAAIATILSLPDCAVLSSFFNELSIFDNKFINKYRNELANAFPNAWPNPKPEPNLNLNLNLTLAEPKPVVGDYARKSVDKPPNAEKSFFGKNDYDAAAACCCALLGKRRLSLLDQEHLSAWCLQFDFENAVKPLLYEGLEKFMKANAGKRPSSLAYFIGRIKENAA